MEAGIRVPATVFPPPDFARPDQREAFFADSRQKLGPGKWIVRSSMSGEDAADFSFAGAFLSLPLEDANPDSLWQTVQAVLASAKTPQAEQQILSAGLNPREFSAGFFIQSYVPGKISGVCFSRRPDQVWKKEGLLEWAWGSGEGVVQGTAKTQIEYQLSPPAPESPIAPFWDELWQVTAKIEALLAAPADIEWVWDGKKLWFVQARPIATEEARLLASAPETRWSRSLSLERFPEPITPMGWTAIEDSMESNLRSLNQELGIRVSSTNKIAVRLKSRVYTDPDFFKFPSRVKIQWSRYISPFGPHLILLLKAFARFFKSVVFLKNLTTTFAHLRLDIVLALIGPQAFFWKRKWKSHVEKNLEEIKKFHLHSSLDPEGILQQMYAMRILSLKFLEPDIVIYIVKDTLHRSLEKIWTALGFTPLDFADLINHFDNNRTLMMGEDWNELIRCLSQSPRCESFLSRLHSQNPLAADELEPESKKSWVSFLERNGHCRTSWDMAVPGWGDAPWILVPLIRASLFSKNSSSDPRSKTQHGIQELQIPLELLKAFMQMDEELHFLTGYLIEPSRKLVLLAGQALQAKGLLQTPEDAFYLELKELKKALRNPDTNLSFLCAKRRAEFERHKKLTPLMDFPPRVETTTELPQDSSASILRGIPVSAGTIEGNVFVLEHLDQIPQITAGAILVTTAPNPAFVPLYPLLGGLVTVTGGILSHGFVAAREFGIPAVSGISEALTRLSAGTKIRLNGEKGTVEIL